jgi:hypothetical protein
VELLLERLEGSVDGALALSVVEHASLVVSKLGLEVSAARDEVLEVHRLVRDRLVHDRRLVNLVVRGDNSVVYVVLVSVALDHGLNDVVYVVVVVLVNNLALVDNGALLAGVLELVVVLVQASESLAIGVGVDVLLLDVRNGVNLVVVLDLSVLSVKNRLDVVL